MTKWIMTIYFFLCHQMFSPCFRQQTSTAALDQLTYLYAEALPSTPAHLFATSMPSASVPTLASMA